MNNSKKQTIARTKQANKQTNKQTKKRKSHLNDNNKNDVVYRYISVDGGGKKKGTCAAWTFV